MAQWARRAAPGGALRGEGAHLSEGNAATGDGGGTQVGTRFDAVGDNVKRLDLDEPSIGSVDDQLLGADPLDAHTAAAQYLAKLHHFGFTRGVGDDGFAFGQCGGHHDVGSAGDGDFVKDDMRAFESLACFGIDIAPFDGDLRPHHLQCFEVQIDGALPDGATAGQRNFTVPFARQQRPKDKDRGAHGLDDVVDGAGVDDVLGVDRDAVIARRVGGAEMFKQLEQGFDVFDGGQVVEGYVVFGQQSHGNQRQSGVFGS